MLAWQILFYQWFEELVREALREDAVVTEDATVVAPRVGGQAARGSAGVTRQTRRQSNLAPRPGQAIVHARRPSGAWQALGDGSRSRAHVVNQPAGVIPVLSPIPLPPLPHVVSDGEMNFTIRSYGPYDAPLLPQSPDTYPRGGAHEVQTADDGAPLYPVTDPTRLVLYSPTGPFPELGNDGAARLTTERPALGGYISIGDASYGFGYDPTNGFWIAGLETRRWWGFAQEGERILPIDEDGYIRHHSLGLLHPLGEEEPGGPLEGGYDLRFQARAPEFLWAGGEITYPTYYDPDTMVNGAFLDQNVGAADLDVMAVRSVVTRPIKRYSRTSIDTLGTVDFDRWDWNPAAGTTTIAWDETGYVDIPANAHMQIRCWPWMFTSGATVIGNHDTGSTRIKVSTLGDFLAPGRTIRFSYPGVGYTGSISHRILSVETVGDPAEFFINITPGTAVNTALDGHACDFYAPWVPLDGGGRRWWVDDSGSVEISQCTVLTSRKPSAQSVAVNVAPGYKAVFTRTLVLTLSTGVPGELEIFTYTISGTMAYQLQRGGGLYSDANRLNRIANGAFAGNSHIPQFAYGPPIDASFTSGTPADYTPSGFPTQVEQCTIAVNDTHGVDTVGVLTAGIRAERPASHTAFGNRALGFVRDFTSEIEREFHDIACPINYQGPLGTLRNPAATIGGGSWGGITIPTRDYCADAFTFAGRTYAVVLDEDFVLHVGIDGVAVFAGTVFDFFPGIGNDRLPYTFPGAFPQYDSSRAWPEVGEAHDARPVQPHYQWSHPAWPFVNSAIVGPFVVAAWQQGQHVVGIHHKSVAAPVVLFMRY
jgi:hypothetical protein